jgi:hypothetical protein
LPVKGGSLPEGSGKKIQAKRVKKQKTDRRFQRRLIEKFDQHYQQTLAAASLIFLLYCRPVQLLHLGRPSASKLCRTAFQN